jgi:hypothetical protein
MRQGLWATAEQVERYIRSTGAVREKFTRRALLGDLIDPDPATALRIKEAAEYTEYHYLGEAEPAPVQAPIRDSQLATAIRTATGRHVHAAAEAAPIGEEQLTLIPAAVVEALAEHLAELVAQEDARRPSIRPQQRDDANAGPGPMVRALESGQYQSGVDETPSWIDESEYDPRNGACSR